MTSTNPVTHGYGVPAALQSFDNPSSSSIVQPIMRRLDSAAPNRFSAAITSKTEQQQKNQRGQHGAFPDSPSLTQSQSKTSTISNTLQTQRINTQPEDSLEYFIKFPTPNYRQEIDETPESDFVFVYKEETNVPIVMLLGWAGCQDRYLMKYSKIYEDRGLITVRYTAPVDTLFWNRSAMVPIGEKILKLIYDMNFDTHPVIFHIFSNGGAYLYQHISLAIQKHKTPLQIRGMIFDSAPGERRVLGLYRAINAIYGRDKKKFYCFTAILITLTLSIMWFVEETFVAFKNLFTTKRQVQTNPFNDLKNAVNEFPQMFLYSKGDAVIPYQDVESFIKIRKQQGVEVSSACFEDAEHVKIYIKYPKQYIQCICRFINNCLSRPYTVLPQSYGTSPTSDSSTKYD